MTPLDHVVALGRVLDELGLPWVLGGSLASSLVGEPRSTVDIDVAVLLADEHVDSIVRAAQDDYYVSTEMVREAVASHSSFNLLHHRTGMKVDAFPLADDLLDRWQLGRRQRVGVADLLERVLAEVDSNRRRAVRPEGARSKDQRDQSVRRCLKRRCLSDRLCRGSGSRMLCGDHPVVVGDGALDRDG